MAEKPSAVSPPSANSAPTAPVRRLSIPGKAFLLGEYAVLAGAPALVAAFGPRFVLSAHKFHGSSETVFHPESPAGIFCRNQHLSSRWHWLDPASGAGGFGASTAQFALVAATAGSLDPFQLWREYRRMATPSSGVPPSGADLVAQVLGGVVEFHPPQADGQDPSVVSRQQSLRSISIAVLQASGQTGRKTPTHQHLLQITSQMLERLRSELEPILQRALPAFCVGDAMTFSECLSQYAEVLARFDLELAATRADREAIIKVPGVLGVKGTGALQSDALIVAFDSTRFDRGQFEALIKVRGLSLWCEKLSAEPGLEVTL